MYAFNRGGGSRRQPTPTNVQCQKCLKRGHYSYECKTNLQERPYKPRPSRTQQLLNPKLAPKLTNEALDDASRKKGVADQELAKKEAERARKRQLEGADDDGEHFSPSNAKRQRSRSLDSVSSISTRSSRSPPPRRRQSPSPAPRDSPPRARRQSSSSYDSGSDRSPRRSSLSPGEASYPPRRGHGHRRGDFPSPVRAPPSRGGARSAAREDSVDSYRSPPPRRRRSPSPVARNEGSNNRSYRRHDSRSPVRQDQGGYGRYRDRNDRDRVESGSEQQRRTAPQPRRQPSPPRERSLSPFSKRLALTQAMNMGR